MPTWVTLTPEVVPDVPGIDMQTGAEYGFFGPTNPNNAAGATRSNFCTLFGGSIPRPTFGPKKPSQQPVSSSNQNMIPNEKGRPSAAAYAAIGDIKLARPKDFFDLQLPPSYISNIRKGTNFRASEEGWNWCCGS